MGCSAVQWSGMEWSRWNAVQCSGMEWSRWNAVQWSGMEWNRWNGVLWIGMSAKKNDFLCFGQSDKFHFSKAAHLFSFCEARSKMVSNKRRATTFHVLKIAFLLCFVEKTSFLSFVGNKSKIYRKSGPKERYFEMAFFCH